MFDFIKIINSQRHKAMIFYLIANEEQPNQELVRHLMFMAANKYLCFICYPQKAEDIANNDIANNDIADNDIADNASADNASTCNGSTGNDRADNDRADNENIKVLRRNLYLIYKGLSIIPAIKNLSAIILSTRNIDPVWSEFLYQKLIWFHVDSDLADETTGDIYGEANLISCFLSNEMFTEKFEKLFSDNRCILFLARENNQYNLELLEEKLKWMPESWRVFANLDLQNKIAVLTSTFLDFEGEYFYSGGAERYLLDLSEICRELGKDLVIFQYGNYPWMRRFNNIDIISLSQKGLKAEGWILKCAREFNRIFYESVYGRTALNIYSAFYEAWPLAASPNIGISHGVSWDNPYCDFDNAFEFWLMNQRNIEGARVCEDLISVDTNTANWFQTIDYRLSQKIKVIPNYVDLSVFKPKECYLEKKDKIIILYPRQLYSGRGLYLVLEIMDEILNKYPHTEFHFAGRGGEDDINKVVEKQKKRPGRIKYAPMSMEEMPGVYQNSDIALIPSVHSEGTSLSCLEAMASGNAIIATRIGGLSDLIISNYNGFLIDPRPEELKLAIIALVENHELLTTLKRRSVEVAGAFSKTRWQKRWKSIIEDKLDKSYSFIDQKRNCRAVEVRICDTSLEYCELGELVIPLLAEGCLVYIRTNKVPDPNLSFSRIQWLAPDTPIFSEPDSIIEVKEE